MLSFIAAAVPIAGSLYVAGSMLYEYTHAAHVARAYARIQERFRPEYDALDMKVLGGAEYDRQTKAISARRRTLLEQNGLDPTLGTAAAFNRMQKPAAPRGVDLRRQWSLLLSSAIGVVLVAIDVSTPGG